VARNLICRRFPRLVHGERKVYTSKGEEETFAIFLDKQKTIDPPIFFCVSQLFGAKQISVNWKEESQTKRSPNKNSCHYQTSHTNTFQNVMQKFSVFSEKYEKI
jgi:hypothetical protein